MGTANDIQEMRQLLASIREAIESHGAQGAGHNAPAPVAERHDPVGAHAGADLLAEAPDTAGAEREDWPDDDLEWVEPGSAPSETTWHMAEPAGEAAAPQAREAAATAVPAGMSRASHAQAAGVAEAAEDSTLSSVAEHAAAATMLARTGTDDAASALTTGESSSPPSGTAAPAPAIPRFAVLSGGRSDAEVLGNSRLSAPVQARVKAAMARMERIEAARRALGGEAALRRLVADLVEPLIENWLNEHLADIVERRVQAELDRILKRED